MELTLIPFVVHPPRTQGHVPHSKHVDCSVTFSRRCCDTSACSTASQPPRDIHP